MTICGYNNTIGAGLRLLFDGLYKAVYEKTTEKITFQDILRRELIEIPAINSGLNSSKSVSLKMFMGLNHLVLPFFRHLIDACENGSLSKEKYNIELERCISVLEQAEDYSLAIPYSDNPSDVETRALLIGKWIAENLNQ